MNKEQIEARIQELTTKEQKQMQVASQVQANLSAIHGAKQDCQYWLSKLGAQTPETIPAPAPDFVPMQENAPDVSA